MMSPFAKGQRPAIAKATAGSLRGPFMSEGWKLKAE
jgi:hypothetical protein